MDDCYDGLLYWRSGVFSIAVGLALQWLHFDTTTDISKQLGCSYQPA
jgi:hypothetical protein